MNKRYFQVIGIAWCLVFVCSVFANPKSIFYSEFLNAFFVGIACFALANVFIPETDEEEKE